MTTEPDYAGLIGWLQFFSQGDEKSPHARAALAIRALLESNAALERELQYEEGNLASCWDDLRAAEAERDRLAERVAELERGLKPFSDAYGFLGTQGATRAEKWDILGMYATIVDFERARSLVKGGWDE